MDQVRIEGMIRSENPITVATWLRHAAGEKLGDEIAVGLQVGYELGEPVVALLPGDAGQRDTEAVVAAEDASGDGRVAFLQ